MAQKTKAPVKGEKKKPAIRLEDYDKLPAAPKKRPSMFDEEEEAQGTCDELNAAFAAGQASREQWTPCSKRLPEEGQRVAVLLTSQPDMEPGAEVSQYWPRSGGWNKSVTHWFPLPPSPPKKP